MIVYLSRLNAPARLRRFAGQPVVQRVAWVVATFGISQILRLVTSPLLASLLTPAIIGVVTLLNTLRTGIELITDVGVGQSIVVSEHGDDPVFISTAWTIQFLRGLGLALVGLVVSWPLAKVYGDTSLAWVFSVTSVGFVLTGMAAPARFLMQRHQQAKKLALFGLALTVMNSAVTISLAAIWPSIWSMTLSVLIYSFISMVSQFVLLDGPRPRFTLDKVYARSIFRFGRWVFVSSIIYFVGMNFDRLYLPIALPFALFGVYGIAKQISDAVTMLMQQLGSYVVFPAIAKVSDRISEEVTRIARLRLALMLAVTTGISLAVSCADVFVRFAYDGRYEAAVVFLPILIVGAWFSVQATMAESIALGMRAPAKASAGNAARLLWTAILLPVAFQWHGTFAAIIVIAFADMPRYLLLSLGLRSSGLSFWRQDAFLLLAGVAFALLFREGLVRMDVVDGLIATDQLRQIVALYH